ncbi:MAG TPA: DUF2321 domain-containing protein [Gemmatimonadales bacterium]|nr:DUF2321 domain-containing protein [Gemmatimonadales bacterium]
MTGLDQSPPSPDTGGHGKLSDLPREARICARGHLVMQRQGERHGSSAQTCPTCGALTIAACPGCREPIFGLAALSTGEAPMPGRLPQYCHCCGRPFPWTEKLISAVRLALRDVPALDQYERDQLRRSIHHIIHETSQTRLAVIRINSMLSRIEGETAHSLRGLFLGIATESVKPMLQNAGTAATD